MEKKKTAEEEKFEKGYNLKKRAIAVLMIAFLLDLLVSRVFSEAIFIRSILNGTMGLALLVSSFVSFRQLGSNQLNLLAKALSAMFGLVALLIGMFFAIYAIDIHF